ncbi:MAG: EAL domain-containing protein [Candidatus Sedimenticola sp. 20ELBAFRAG]
MTDQEEESNHNLFAELDALQDRLSELDSLVSQPRPAMEEGAGAERPRLDEEDESLYQALLNAIENDELRLYWQPRFDRSGELAGAEALLRWLHPVKGLLPARDFLHLASQTELMIDLDSWALEQACRFQQQLSAEMPETGSMPIAVNISPELFSQNDFSERVSVVIETIQANPARLTLEVTENMLVGEMSVIGARMSELKKLGVRFSIDDFGTGCTSLPALKLLPLDEIKIDEYLVHDLVNDHHSAVIVEAMIALASKMGLSVVAEGVESPKEREFLYKKNCKGYQGELFCKPLSGDKFMALLLEQGEAAQKSKGMQSAFEGF